MMMKNIVLSLVVGSAALASSAQADLIAYWNFNASTAGSGGGLGTVDQTYPFAANQGSGSIYTNFSINTVAGATSSNTGDLGTFGGTLTNAIAPDTAGGALALRAGNGLNSGVTNNGKYVEFRLNAGLFADDIVLTYASQRSGTGFTTQQWQYSTDGGTTYVNFATVSGIPSAFGSVVQTVNFAAADLGGYADLRFRVVVDGATNQGGNNRFDNIQFNASAIPTPGALALLGLGGLVAGRRRR
jgi:MYXO-CTERM domain-containing protein